MRDSNPYLRPTEENIQSVQAYLYFVWEREAMRIAKQNGYNGPLTVDPVLVKYRFTNIRRRDDRMTQWFLKHLIEPFRSRDDLWFTLLVARLINWPPTLQSLLEQDVLPCAPVDFDADAFCAVLEAQMDAGVKTYGGAYMVYPTMRDPGEAKSRSLAKHIIGEAIERREQIDAALWGSKEEPSIAVFVNELTKCFGISSFIAGQVAADLSYSPAQLGDACDLYTWAPLGPGSQKGLNYMLGKDPLKQWEQNMFNAALASANEHIEKNLGIDDLTLHDVQNTFCEFGKYARTVLGEGVPKSIYKSEGAY